MKSLFIKDKTRRTLFLKQEKKYKMLKFLIQNQKLTILARVFLLQKLSKISRQAGSLTKIKNRCSVTFRGRSNIRAFKLSRIRLRELFALGLVPGYKKSTW